MIPIAILKYIAKQQGAAAPSYDGVYIDFDGDSLTEGVGTDGTSPSSNGVNQVNGDFTYPKQTMALLDDNSIDYSVHGYPGQTAAWFSANKLNEAIARFVPNKNNIAVIFFLANEITASSDATAIYNSIVSLHAAFRTAGFKTVAVLGLNRKDAYAQSYTNATRLAVNQMMLNNPSFCDAIAHVENRPNIYADDAPDNATYFAVNDVDGLSKVHLTNAGAGELAIPVAAAIETLL